MESMHMNPNFFTDPEKFNPDRYLNNTRTMQSSANGKIHERDHFNFGWGRYKNKNLLYTTHTNFHG